MQLRIILTTLGLASVLALSNSSFADSSTPGTAILESTVSQDIRTMFTLGAQVYPGVFVNGSGWYSYSGYTYKFFPGAGIYVGVKDGNLFLIGGTYGNSFISRGAVTAINAALQNAIDHPPAAVPTVTADFANIASVKTTYDLPRLFEELTVESTAVSGSVTTVAQMKMERQGVEQVGSFSTEHIKVTMSTGGSSTVNDLWVDSQGTVRHYIANGFDWGTGAQADLIGRGLVSSMLLALAGADNATLQAAIASELKSPNYSQKVQKRMIGNAEYETLVLNVSAASIINYTLELSDLGSFSMTTYYNAITTGIGRSAFQVLSLKLR